MKKRISHPSSFDSLMGALELEQQLDKDLNEFKQQLIEDMVELAAYTKEKKIRRRVIGGLSTVVFVLMFASVLYFANVVNHMMPGLSVILSVLLASIACIFVEYLLNVGCIQKLSSEGVMQIKEHNELIIRLFKIATGIK
jgi:hypothetical protein